VGAERHQDETILAQVEGDGKNGAEAPAAPLAWAGQVVMVSVWWPAVVGTVTSVPRLVSTTR
jgi:hypothetical protein